MRGVRGEEIKDYSFIFAESRNLQTYMSFMAIYEKYDWFFNLLLIDPFDESICCGGISN